MLVVYYLVEFSYLIKIWFIMGMLAEIFSSIKDIVL